jgi:hypothetical protein
MARISFWNGAPENAERYKGLAWTVKQSERGLLILRIWKGKQRKPYIHELILPASVAERIEQQKHLFDQQQEWKAKLAHDRADKLAAMRDSIQVGTILHGSWGWEQTNCEYFEVVERRGAFAIVREIAQRSKPGSEGFMCDQRYPVPGKFIGEPIKKLITAYGLAFEHFTASPCDPAESHYCSWYA